MNAYEENALIPNIDAALTAGNLASLPVWLLVVLGLVALAEVVLDVIALVDLYRRPLTQVALGNKWVWVILIILINLIGAVLYLAIGRKRAPVSDDPARSSERRGTASSVADALYGAADDTKPQ